MGPFLKTLAEKSVQGTGMVSNSIPEMTVCSHAPIKAASEPLPRPLGKAWSLKQMGNGEKRLGLGKKIYRYGYSMTSIKIKKCVL